MKKDRSENSDGIPTNVSEKAFKLVIKNEKKGELVVQLDGIANGMSPLPHCRIGLVTVRFCC